MISEKIFVLQQGFMDYGYEDTVTFSRYINLDIQTFNGSQNFLWIYKHWITMDIQTLDSEIFIGYKH